MSKFYGDKEIAEVKDHPVHAEHQILVFADGTEKSVSKKLIAAGVITDEPIDATKLRDLRCFPVVSAILEVMLELDIHMSEVEFTFLRATMSLNESLKKANEKLWGVDTQNQTMLQVHDVLLKGEVKSPIKSEDLNQEG